MAVKKTHEQYEQELFEKELNFLPLEPYNGRKVAILHECIEGHQWKAEPDMILKGKNCPICSHQAKLKPAGDYEAAIDFKVLEPYQGNKVPILHECGLGHQWKARPDSILGGSGCPKCAHENHPGSYNNTRFARDRVLADSPGIMYVIVLVHKGTQERTCVKIGITKGTSNKDVLRRAKGFNGYEPRIQKEVYGTLEQVFNLEQKLHDQWRDHRYLDSHKFGGHTELFEIGKLKEILQSIPTKIEPNKI